MTAEELAASQRTAGLVTDPVARDVARWASSRQLTPVAVAAIALGFGVIAAAWLTGVSLRAWMIAFGALLAAFVAGRAARLMGGELMDPVTAWSVGACAVLTELAVYAGMAGGASMDAAKGGLSGPFASRLRGTSLAGLGGTGPAGVWRLAVAAVVMLALVEMAGICLAATRADAVRPGRFLVLTGAPGGARLVVIGAAVLLAGPRLTFLLLLALGVLALAATAIRASRAAARALVRDAGEAAGWLPGCRGDGPLAIWLGKFVAGRLPPLPPLVVGLLVTGMLAALGLQNLSGILMFTPVEAMLLAALASWHPHDGPRDWLAPALVQAGEYVYLAAAGFAGRVMAPVTLALLAAVLLRHQEIGYQARSLFPSRPAADSRGFGWEGRMIVAGIAAAAGILPVVYPLLAVYLWALLAREFAVGWSAGHAAVDG